MRRLAQLVGTLDPDSALVLEQQVDLCHSLVALLKMVPLFLYRVMLTGGLFFEAAMSA